MWAHLASPHGAAPPYMASHHGASRCGRAPSAMPRATTSAATTPRPAATSHRGDGRTEGGGEGQQEVRYGRPGGKSGEGTRRRDLRRLGGREGRRWGRHRRMEGKKIGEEVGRPGGRLDGENREGSAGCGWTEERGAANSKS